MELNLDWRRCTATVWPEVSYEVRPLRVWAFQELMACWEAEAEDDAAEHASGDAAGALQPDRSARLMAVARRVLPEHVRDVRGLTLRREGRSEPASAEALCEEAALLPLAGEVLARLIEISEVDGAAEKN